jgi:toxin YoeB
VSWRVTFNKQAKKDAVKIARAGLQPQVESLLQILKKNPYSSHPTFEKLVGEVTGLYSRRINIHHRLVYKILKDIKTVIVVRMWTHYK